MKTKQLTLEGFEKHIFDYKNSKDWNFIGEKPAIVDFYADWCGPCKMVAPIFEELANEFPEIDIYKVDTEAEERLSAMFEIRSIPSILFIPKDGEPMMQAGALPKEVLKDVINKELLKKEEES